MNSQFVWKLSDIEDDHLLNATYYSPELEDRHLVSIPPKKLFSSMTTRQNKLDRFVPVKYFPVSLIFTLVEHLSSQV